MYQTKLITNIDRLEFLEVKYGITDINLYAYQLGNKINVIGEVFGERLNADIIFLCTVFNGSGEIIGVGQNECFGGSGVVKYIIEANNFMGIHAFKISEFIAEGEIVQGIRIYPKSVV